MGGAYQNVTKKKEAYEIKVQLKTDGKPIKMITKRCRTFSTWMINEKIKNTLWLQKLMKYWKRRNKKKNGSKPNAIQNLELKTQSWGT